MRFRHLEKTRKYHYFVVFGVLQAVLLSELLALYFQKQQQHELIVEFV